MMKDQNTLEMENRELRCQLEMLRDEKKAVCAENAELRKRLENINRDSDGAIQEVHRLRDGIINLVALIGGVKL